MKRISKKGLEDILIAKGLVNPEKVQEARQYQERQGCRISEALVKLELVSEESVAWALTVQYGFPYMPLTQYDIDEGVASSIPKAYAEKYGVVAMDKTGESLTVAMSDPLNEEAMSELEKITKCKIQMFITTLSDVQRIIDSHYSVPKKEE
jgi:type IV pilus assembly protein PilB